ncbi:MAG: hypothetical protein V7742_21105 [Halioglobus sp.]
MVRQQSGHALLAPTNREFGEHCPSPDFCAAKIVELHSRRLVGASNGRCRTKHTILPALRSSMSDAYFHPIDQEFGEHCPSPDFCTAN